MEFESYLCLIFLYLIDEAEGTDIDNPIDFDFVEFVYQRQQRGDSKYSHREPKLPQAVEILAKK